MARRNPRREALLEQVARRQRAAGQKVSRLERADRPVHVRKAGLDPRQPMEAVRQMSTPQLHRYLGRLERFTSRSTAFVAGQHGQPIERSTWNRLVRAQKQINARAEAYDESVAGILLPASPGAKRLTVEERRATILEKRFPTAGGRLRTLHATTRETAGSIVDEKAARLLARALEKQLAPGWLERQIRIQRRIVKQMLVASGDADVWEGVKADPDNGIEGRPGVKDLSDEQFQVLFDETDFMKNIGGRYPEKQVRDGRPGDGDADDVFNQAGKNLHRLAEWAPSIPKRNSGTVRSEYTDTSAGPVPTQGSVYTEKSPAGAIRTQPGATRIGDSVVTASGKVWTVGAVASKGNAGLIPEGHIYVERGGTGKWVNPRGYTNVDAANRRKRRGSS